MIFSLMIVKRNFFLFMMYLLNGLGTRSNFLAIFSFLTELLKHVSSNLLRTSQIFVFSGLFLRVSEAVEKRAPSLISYFDHFKI
jgi:hypothetical protein